MIYELKVYSPNQGKETALRRRFLEKTLPLFERHGIAVAALFAPVDVPSQLWYITRFANEEARLAAWAHFQADPEWLAIKQATDADGPLMESQRTTVLTALDGALAL
jgi:hypothetical protein